MGGRGPARDGLALGKAIRQSRAKSHIAWQSAVLGAPIEHLYPGRAPQLRPMTPKEAATSLLWVAIDEVKTAVVLS
jgi:hypothetical protein